MNETLSQWRDGDSFCMTFPSAPKPRMIALVMGPASDVARARKDPDGVWDEFLRRHPGWAKRLEGATNMSKLRSTADVPAYFRPRAVRAGRSPATRVTSRTRSSATASATRCGWDTRSPRWSRRDARRARRAGRDAAPLRAGARRGVPVRLPLRQQRDAHPAPVPGARRAGPGGPEAQPLGPGPTCATSSSGFATSRTCCRSAGSPAASRWRCATTCATVLGALPQTIKSGSAISPSTCASGPSPAPGASARRADPRLRAPRLDLAGHAQAARGPHGPAGRGHVGALRRR